MNRSSTAQLSRYARSAARGLGRGLFVGALIVGLLGVGLVFTLFLLVTAAMDGIAVAAALLALMAGGLGAFWLEARRGAATTDHVSPEHIPPTDVINVSRVPVTGIAGLGLVAIAAAAAFEFKLALVVTGAGVIGGAAGAALLVLLRKPAAPISSHLS